jgi:hypothetical protein
MVPERVRDLLRRGQIPGGNLETWLSSLAERQPFLTEAESSYNYGLFAEISNQLVGLISEPQQGFWPTAPPSLHRLLRVWHRSRAAVLTFNYDTIVEESLAALDIPGSHGNLVGAVLMYLPRPAFPVWGGDEEPSTLRLLKLHGSIDWHWNPEDHSGDSLCRLPPGISPREARAALAGKVPFIVPPLATKGPFYSLGLVRELWQEAARAVADAERIIVLGYSVPLTDLAVTAMLSQMASDTAKWHVVDPDGSLVAERLSVVGIPRANITIHPAVDQFVTIYEESFCRGMSGQLATELGQYAIDSVAPIMIRPNRSQWAVATDITVEENKVILHAEWLDPRVPIPAEYPRGEALLTLVERLAPARPIAVQFTDSSAQYLVLGANDPLDVRGSHAVLNWVPLEIQNQPTA